MTFFSRTASPYRLGCLRAFLGFALFAEGLTWAPHLLPLFSRSGLVNGPLQDYFVLPSLLRIQLTGASEFLALRMCYAAFLASAFLLGLGWHTRASSFAAWITFRILYSSCPMVMYGVDHYASVLLFYFCWMPVGKTVSLDALRHAEGAVPTKAAFLSILLLRVHLSLTYLAAGVGKAVGEQWWNGEAVWRAMNLPLFSTMDFGWMAFTPWLAKLFAWGTLVLELGYPLLLLPKKTRPVGLTLLIGLHLGIAVAMGLVSFGLVMALVTIALFAKDPLRFVAPSAWGFSLARPARPSAVAERDRNPVPV